MVPPKYANDTNVDGYYRMLLANNIIYHLRVTSAIGEIDFYQLSFLLILRDKSREWMGWLAIHHECSLASVKFYSYTTNGQNMQHLATLS